MVFLSGNLLPVVDDFDDVTTVLLVDGSDTAATDVVGAVKVIVVTVVVVDDTMITVDVEVGALTVTGVSVASLLFEVAAKTVDVAAVTTSVEVVNEATSASDVVLNLDAAVVETPSSSEMTTVSWKSNSISGKVGVVVAGAIDA